MDRHTPLRHHGSGPTNGAASLAQALPGDLRALTWLTDTPEVVQVAEQSWPCWPIAVVWSGGTEIVELLLQVTHTTDRWGQASHHGEARLRPRGGPEWLRFETWGDAYGVSGATVRGPPPGPTLALVLTAILARPVDAIAVLWDGLPEQSAFSWMKPILEEGVLRVEDTPLDPGLDR
jgi:hypothetical protein